MSQKLAIGDVFEVQLDPSTVRFFQYVADDATQLNSQVIRVFSEDYGAGEPLDLRRVTTGSIDFHAHVFLRIGLKRQFWRKVGHAEPPADLDLLFRDSNDYGNPEIKISHDWYVWRPNGPFETVGELSPDCQRAEIGVVVPPRSLVYRIQNGKWDFVYPAYEPKGR